jgi:hypothetical protein
VIFVIFVVEGFPKPAMAKSLEVHAMRTAGQGRGNAKNAAAGLPATALMIQQRTA